MRAGLFITSIADPRDDVDRRRALFQDRAISCAGQDVLDHVLRDRVDCVRASVIDRIFTRYRFAIDLRTQRCFGLIRRVRRRLYTFLRAINVAQDPPINRISIFIRLATLIIRSVHRFIASCCASNAVINNVIDFRIRRQQLGGDDQRASFID